MAIPSSVTLAQKQATNHDDNFMLGLVSFTEKTYLKYLAVSQYFVLHYSAELSSCTHLAGDSDKTRDV